MSHRGHLASDTCSDAARRQVEIWRRRTPAQKLQTVGDLRQTVLDLALAGIRQRYPAADERECFLRLMRMTLGPQLAVAVYPELAHLPDVWARPEPSARPLPGRDQNRAPGTHSA